MRENGRPRLLGGVDGNRRLTALTGLVLLALLLVELATVPGLRSHVTVHMFVGLLLLPLALLKLASTGYRFSGYYLRREEYRASGPPAILPRLLAPFLILTTLTLLGSGLVLTFESPSRQNGALALHKASFGVWLFLIGVHVLLNLKSLGRLLKADWTRRLPERTSSSLVAGRGHRLALLLVALVAGLVLALLTLPLDHHWASYFSQFRFGSD
jgi:hypothetical protein